MRKSLATEVSKQLSNAYYKGFDQSRDVLDAGNVPFVTGDLKKDSFIFYAEQEYGVRAEKHAKPNGEPTGWKYTIVDEEKYIWFKLRWS